MNISIVTIPHVEQRYNTPGDWAVTGEGNLSIRVSDTGNKDYNFLIALHEMVEAYTFLKRGGVPKDIDDFDNAFEEMRSKYPQIVGEKEPGDDPSSPYFKEHNRATRIEEWMAGNLDVEWPKYEETVNALSKTYPNFQFSLT